MPARIALNGSIIKKYQWLSEINEQTGLLSETNISRACQLRLWPVTQIISTVVSLVQIAGMNMFYEYFHQQGVEIPPYDTEKFESTS